MPCTIEEAAELARSAMSGKNGETVIDPISLDVEGLESTGRVLTKMKFGFLAASGWRTMKAAFGDELAARAIQPLIALDIKANNFIAKGYNQYKELTGAIRSRFRGIPYAKELEASKALRFTTKDGKFTGDRAAYSPEIIDSALKTRKLMEDAAAEHTIDVDMFLQYRDLLQQRPGGILREPNMDSPLEAAFHERLKATPGQQNFYSEVERKHIVLNSDATMTADFTSFMRAIANAHIRKPGIEALERDVINPAFNVRFIRRGGKVDVMADDGYGMWKELVHNIYGGMTPQEMNINGTLQQLGAMFGTKFDPRASMKWSHGITSAIYGGAMGGRPSSIIRQLFQSVPTYANYGFRDTMEGFTNVFKTGAIQDLIERNVLASHMTNLAETVGVARGVGKAVSDVSEVALKAFSVVDQMQRAGTALTAQANFRRLGGLNPTSNPEAWVNKLSATREVKDEILRLVKAGKVRDAETAYMLDGVGTLQYDYGKANQPAVFRGPIGNMMSTFMSYPMNSFEMARIFAKRGFVEGDFRPMIRLTLATLGMTYAGSEFLNADLRSAFLMGSIPHSMAIPKIGMDTFQSGVSTFEWMTGSLFNIGETDYRKHQRMMNYRNTARDARLFVPGGLLFFEDIPKYLETGSLARMFALTPKADVINQQAQATTQAKRAATREESGAMPSLSRLQGLPRIGTQQ